MKVETQFLNAELITSNDDARNSSVRLLVIPAGVKPHWMKYETLYLLKNISINQIDTDICVFVRTAWSM